MTADIGNDDRWELLDIVAELVATKRSADAILDRLDFPLGHRPLWDDTPAIVWNDIFALLAQGIVEPPAFRRLIDTMLKKYPHNERLRALGSRSEPPPPIAARSDAAGVFISYSHDDGVEYAGALAKVLGTAGLEVFYDTDLRNGQRWVDELQAAITRASAMVVLMTEGGLQSSWMAREHLLAERLSLSIHPLLVSGRPWFAFLDIQFDDVTDGSMPSPAFLAALQTAGRDGSRPTG